MIVKDEGALIEISNIVFWAVPSLQLKMKEYKQADQEKTRWSLNRHANRITEIAFKNH